MARVTLYADSWNLFAVGPVAAPGKLSPLFVHEVPRVSTANQIKSNQATSFQMPLRASLCLGHTPIMLVEFHEWSRLARRMLCTTMTMVPRGRAGASLNPSMVRGGGVLSVRMGCAALPGSLHIYMSLM